MEKRYYEKKPKRNETIRSIGVMTTVVRFDIAKCKDEEHKGMWECNEQEISHREPLCQDDYSRVVSCLVRAKYSADDVEAITLNYTADQEKYAEVMNELQAWRTTAKERAREIVKVS